MRLAALAQDVGGDDLALVLPDVGQLPDAVDVTERPEAVRRTQARIDGDALRVGADADRLQAQLPHAGPPAGGDEEAVTSQLATVVELEDVVGALAPGGGGMHAEVQLDAFLAQDVAERLAQGPRLAREQVLPALDERHLSSEATDGLRHLDAHRPAAEHEQPPGDRLHAGDLAVRPDPVELAKARDGWKERLGARREDDVLRAVALPVHVHDARSGQAPMAPQQVDPPGYRDWRFITVAQERGELNDIRAVLGNDKAIKAYRDGTLPFPEGTIIARLAPILRGRAPEERGSIHGQGLGEIRRVFSPYSP